MNNLKSILVALQRSSTILNDSSRASGPNTAAPWKSADAGIKGCAALFLPWIAPSGPAVMGPYATGALFHSKCPVCILPLTRVGDVLSLSTSS